MDETEIGHHRLAVAKAAGIKYLEAPTPGPRQIIKEAAPTHLKEMSEDLAKLLCKVQVGWNTNTTPNTLWRSMPLDVKERFQQQAAYIMKEMG